MTTKVCSVCGQAKHVSAFEYMRAQCMTCRRTRNAARVQQQRENALFADPEGFRAKKAQEQATLRDRIRAENALPVLLAFTEAYDRLRADGLERADAVEEAMLEVPDSYRRFPRTRQAK